MLWREPIFNELDRLIEAGVNRIAKPHVPRLGVTKAEMYNLRRRAHPRTYKQHVKPWLLRRNEYLAAKGLPPETDDFLKPARKPPARHLLSGGRAIAAGAAQACRVLQQARLPPR
jgi:hypothetical protein